jgi:phosphoenolpyruvate carboxykinase (ATP)
LPISFQSAKEVHWNLSVPELVEMALLREEAKLTSTGAIVAYTGKYTGRTPQDKHVVREPKFQDDIWWGNNRDITPETFSQLVEKANSVFPSKTLFVVDALGGADPRHTIKVRFVVENAYHALFIRTLLIRPDAEALKDFQPDWTITNLCNEKWERVQDGKNHDAMIALNLASQEGVIMGTHYAGEMKKSVFTILNALLPLKGVMSMHCSANVGEEGDTALFFGLSGTGKTTLSADPNRFLIGDDEHGWTDTGVFNFEGGCYAKCINLSQEKEREIWDAIKYGSVLENVVLKEGRVPDYDDTSLTENTRCAYPLEYIEKRVEDGMGGHPKNIFFLTCDASGVLPPISRLNDDLVMFYFLNGYTAKVAGTEAGIKDPTLTFSTCFGAPFLPLRPKVYGDLLKEKIRRHGSKVWLINTGWTGGKYGEGSRISLKYTRSMITAAMKGELDSVEFTKHPIFGVEVPTSCPGVPSEVLDPRSTWADGAAYDETAKDLQGKFEANFRTFA